MVKKKNEDIYVIFCQSNKLSKKDTMLKSTPLLPKGTQYSAVSLCINQLKASRGRDIVLYTSNDPVGTSFTGKYSGNNYKSIGQSLAL